MSIVETLSRADLPAVFLLLFVLVSISATAIIIGILTTAERERQNREKGGHSSGF